MVGPRHSAAPGWRRGEPDTAATDHGYAVARAHPRGPPYGADARRDRAADEAGDLERHVLRNRDARALRQHARLRKRRDERDVVDGPAAPQPTRRPVSQTAPGHRRPGGRAD